MKKISLTVTTLILLLLVFVPRDASAASSTISVKLSNYIGNKTSFNMTPSGLYKVSGTNVSSMARYDGKNRYEVANNIASAGWKNPSTIVIVNRDAFADAISATPLAYKLNAPILYTNAERLTKTTEKQIKKMNPDNILIIGGTKSVSSAAEKTLKKYGKIKRISGKSRYAVSQNIAKEMGNYRQAIVATGSIFTDSASVTPYAARNGYPILLTKKNSLPTYKLPSKVIIVGGEKSVSKKVETQIKKTSTVQRIGGANRYEVSANIVNDLNMNANKLYLANGSIFTDAITFSLLAAKNNSPMVLVKKNSLTSPVTSVVKKQGTYSFQLSGGTKSISSSLQKKLSNEFYLKNNKDYQLNVSNGKISIKGIKTFGSSVRVVPEKYSTKNVIRVNGKPYLGKMNFAVESGYIRPTNENIPFEDYLKGVVPNEMPASWHVEALKAQAVAARTYSVNSIGKVVPDTTAFQVYGGYNWYTNSTKAVDATKGKVLKYNNQLISATYYSSNGGYTEASEEVWSSALPYLVAKADTKDPKNAWTLKLSKTQLSKSLDTTKPASWWSQTEANANQLKGLKNWILKNKETSASDIKIATISDISFSGKTKGQRGKTASVKISYHLKNKTGSYSVNKSTTLSFKMTELRSILGATNLKSTYASVKNNTSDFTISGKGYGHGVGMSQYGAKVRAESGSSYSSILSFYYPGTKLTTN
ncbi:SpoIID/LytB domain-containing protein [Bacillus pumilus]|nr:SpoIID/LytB domain-containing protein [Bacillus pumilus]